MTDSKEKTDKLLEMIVNSLETEKLDSFKRKVITATGSRPEKIQEFFTSDVTDLLIPYAEKWLEFLNPPGIFNGMADGWDLVIAMASVNLNIPFVACLPYDRKPAKMTDKERQMFEKSTRAAAKVIDVSKIHPVKNFKACFAVRDQYMVDKAKDRLGIVLALYPGEFSKGTKLTVKYAVKQQVPVLNVWEEFLNTHKTAAQ